MENAVEALLADLFAERPDGEVLSVHETGDVILRFPGAAPPVDAEYLLVRPPGPAAHGFGRTIGAVRIADVRGEVARAGLLWSDGTPRPGDEARWPPRVTIILLPTDASDLQELSALARRLDHWLELQLLMDRRLRVLRADQPAAERGRTERLREEREYGLLVAPLLVSTPGGVEFVMRVRSVFTGQTLAQRGAPWSSASTSRDSRPGSAPPAPAPPPSSPSPGSAPPAPYGTAIRPVQRAGAINVVEQTAGYLKVALPHPVNAIVLADVDGDRRPEIVGITDRQVIVYRWTGRDLETLLSGDPLPVFTTYLYVDAGDINRNGRDEIVLTAVRTVPRGNRMENALESGIAEARNGRLELLATNLDRHLRVVRRPGQPAAILAQRLGAHDLADGDVERLEWKDDGYHVASRFPAPRFVSSVYADARDDLDGDGHAELAFVAADGRLLLYDAQGRRRWESDEDLGTVDDLGFAQTPRFPDYRGRSFDATAEQLAVWRAIPRRVVFTTSGPSPEVVTVANPRVTVPQVRGGDDGVRGRAVGFGWDREKRTYVKRWESSELAGRALDLAVGDLAGDGRLRLVVLSGTATRRSLEIFTLYAR